MADTMVSSKAIQAYEKSNRLDIQKLNNVQNINTPEQDFYEILKADEQNYITGKINQKTVPTSSVSRLTNNTITNLHTVLEQTEDLSVKLLNKSSSVAETVAAAMHAETLIKTIVSLRDKILSTFQDIVKMNI